MLLTIWEIDIYQNTFIDYHIPTLFWLCPGLCLTPVLKELLAVHINTRSLFLQLIYNVVTWGGILAFSVMALNYYFGEQSKTSHTLKVIGNGSISGGSGGRCRTPYVEVDWQGIEKQIMFPCNTPVYKADSVRFDLKEGFLGYSIIADKELILRSN